jgi:hypothetical protein
VWDAETGRELLTLRGHTGPVTSLAFSPTGQHLSSGGRPFTYGGPPGEVKVWDAETGREVLTLPGCPTDPSGVSWSPDGKRLATASYERAVVIRDITTLEKIQTLKGHSDAVWSVRWSPDGRRLAATGLDQSTVVWDVLSGEKVHTLDIGGVVAWSPDSTRLAGSGRGGASAVGNPTTGQLLWQSVALGSDWISFTPQGYYHGSLAAEQLIRWRLPADKGEWPRLVSPSQLRDTFYRPDLFRHLLKEGDVALALAAADARRGSRTQATDVVRKAPPVILITTPKDLASSKVGEIGVEAVARNAGDDPVTRLQLEVNGRPWGQIQRVQEPKPGQVPVKWPHVQLEPGPNKLRVLAWAGGSRGESDVIRVAWQTPEQSKPHLRLLLIGISKYPPGSGYRELRHAAGDAQRLRDAFVRHGEGLYHGIAEPVVLLDEGATQRKILSALQRFSKEMDTDDVGVVFFAGHGDRHNERVYLAAHDTEQAELVSTGISASQIRDTLAATRGRKYLFLDACHTGGVLRRSIPDDLIRELRQEEAGLVIATACKDDQLANEDEKQGGGFFTTALVEGLSGKGHSFNGLVRAKHLKLYVEERLRELTQPLNTKQAQEPLFVGSEELLDVPLARVGPTP